MRKLLLLTIAMFVFTFSKASLNTPYFPMDLEVYEAGYSEGMQAIEISPNATYQDLITMSHICYRLNDLRIKSVNSANDLDYYNGYHNALLTRKKTSSGGGGSNSGKDLEHLPNP